jgi:hypothetical protein
MEASVSIELTFAVFTLSGIAAGFFISSQIIATNALTASTQKRVWADKLPFDVPVFSDVPVVTASPTVQTPNSQMGVDLGVLSCIIPSTQSTISRVGEARG